MANTPRDYIVVIEVKIPGKAAFEETMEVPGYEISEAVYTALMRLSYLHGADFKPKIKDASPKPSDLQSLVADAMLHLGMRKEKK